MLFGPNVRYFNELEINGEHVDDSDNEDFTNDQLDPDEEDDVEAEATDTDDDLADFTEDEFDAEDDEPVDDVEEEPVDNEPVEDEAVDDNNALDDFTEDEFDASDEEDNVTDDTEAEETETGDEDTEDDAGDDLADFTEDDFDAGDDGGDAGTDDAAGDDTGDNTEEDTADGSGNADSEESVDNNDSDNTLAGMEKNLFSDLTPQQLAIKNNELLQNYIELYETINTIFDSINKIPKTYNNTRPLTFITDQLVGLKDMVNYVITTTYVTRTYVENMAYYKQALVVLEQLNSMLKALVQKPAKS